MYKFLKLLRLHIIGKAGEIGIYKSGEKEENISDNQYYIERYRLLAWFYLRRGQIRKAIDILTEGLDKNPIHDKTYAEMLGWCYRVEGDYDKAEESYRKALAINPYSDRAYGGLAICYREQGKDVLAEEYFLKAVHSRLIRCILPHTIIIIN